MKKFLFPLLALPFFLLLGSCQEKEFETPTCEDAPVEEKEVWLRSASDDGLFIAGIDGDAKSGRLWITHAVEENGQWKPDNPKVISGSGHLFAFYPSKGLAVNQYGAVSVEAQPFGDEYYYYKTTYGERATQHTVRLKKLMVRFKVTLDLTHYKGKKHLEKIELIGVPKRALIDIRSGSITRVESIERTEYRIDKVIGDRFEFEFYSFPADKNDTPCLDIYVDDRVFNAGISVANNRPWLAGEEYKSTISLQNIDDRVVVTTDGVRQKDRIDLAGSGFMPTYQVSCTNNRWRTLPANQAVLLGMFVNNVDSEDFNGDIRLSLEDTAGKIVCQGTYWTDHYIGQGSYEGIRLPFCATVPDGRYRLQLLMRKKGDSKWFKPDIAFDSDNEDDWLVEVRSMPKVLAVRSYVDRAGNVMFTEGTFRTLRVNVPYTYEVRVNSYEQTEKKATLRLYHERNTGLNGHSEYKDREKEEPRVWRDLLAEQSIIIPAESSATYKIPYTIKNRRPNFRRFAGYIYATLQYEGGEEFPLLIDANNIYNLSMGVEKVLGSGATLSKQLNVYPHTNVCIVALE